MTTSSANNSVFRGFFEKQKLTGPNFIDWYRQLRIVLSIEDKLNYLEQPLSPAPVAPAGQHIQRNLENLHANDMLKELKTLFAQQAKQELFQTTRDLHSCKQEEGQLVSSYVLKMKGYIDNRECLGHHVTLGLAVNKAQAVMSSASFAVTYTSVYTDSEPGKAFWGADDEEVSEDGIPRVSYTAEEQPLPPVDSPTAESPGYITESDPEEDPEEYEDDETEDGPDKDEEDEDDEEEEEEHLAPADSTIVVHTDEPVSPPEGTEPAIPPPSTDITIGARITIRPQASISLPPEAEVERLLAMTTPSPSPPISLSPPSAGERLARCTAPPAHSSPPHVPSPLLPSSGNDIPESEKPPRKRLCLSTLGSRYEIKESSTARPNRGQGIDYGFVSTVDAEERRQRIRDVRYGLRDTWIDPAEAVPEEDASGWIVRFSHIHLGVAMDCTSGSRNNLYLWGSYVTLQRDSMDWWRREAYASTEGTSGTATAADRDDPCDKQTELLAHQEQQGRARRPGPYARIPDHQDASGDADSHV
ncbi:hypothetical protein Tco_0156045 [Tanacetum coccineum]